MLFISGMRIIKPCTDGCQYFHRLYKVVSVSKKLTMNDLAAPEILEVMEAVHYRPAVSVIIPFEPKMNAKTELLHALKTAADKAGRELEENYPGETVVPLMQKLRTLIQNLDFNTRKKSIAIYVSPVFEKVLYLDIPVEEKIIVDESFEIRDLVYSKKQLHKYLVLLLNGKESRMYLGNTASFVRIISTTPEPENDIPERVANFSDMAQRREILMDKFLYRTDNALDMMLHAYQLPLFVLGPQKMLGHFKNITRHNSAVVEYIQGNFDAASLQELKNILAPHVADWKKVKQKDLLNQLEEAACKNKLAVGMEDVWHEAMHHKGRLLLVEKNYMYAAQHGSSEDVITEACGQYNKFSYIKDAVDDVIEKVLESGGDVEFTDEELLHDYRHIALIQYY